MQKGTRVKYFIILEWTLYIGLCGLATYFMWGVLKKYFSRQSSFSQYEEPISELPTITFCFIKPQTKKTEYDYGTDFEIGYRIYEGIKPTKTMILKEGKNNLFGSTINLQKILTFYLGNCYKTSKLNTSIYKYEDYSVYFNESIPENDLPSLKTYFTSEQNSYGVVSATWRNGKVVKMQIDKGIFKVIDLKQEKYNYLSTNSNCSNESFYECLEGLLATKVEPFTCSYVSLPSVPICKSNDTKQAFFQAFLNLWVNVDKDGHCPKLCSTLGYHNSGEESYYAEKLFNNTKKNWMGFSYTISNLVTVHNEYLIYDEISVIGSVGGTLGMCIGFSFFGLMSNIINLIHKCFLNLNHPIP